MVVLSIAVLLLDSEIFIIRAKIIGFLQLMRELLFTLCANSARKLFISHVGNFQFMLEPTAGVRLLAG
jgi:hypothetical protein